MSAREIAPGVVIMPVTARDSINTYLLDDVLLDAGTRHNGELLLKRLRGRRVSAHALTHVHADHQGASHQVCAELDIELWAPEGEADDMEAGRIPGAAASLPAKFMRAVAAGPGHPVARGLRAGDEVGGFTVVSSPGHSPDHLSYFRESDRVLVAGDAFRNFNYLTMGPKLALPYPGFSIDQEQTRESAIELVNLRPSLVAFGHGSPVGGEDFMRGMAEIGLA